MARHFVTFKGNTSFCGKIMAFQGMTSQEVWDAAVKVYPLAVDTVHNEREMARLLPRLYFNRNNRVYYKDTCHVYDDSVKLPDGESTIIATYPSDQCSPKKVETVPEVPEPQ